MRLKTTKNSKRKGSTKSEHKQRLEKEAELLKKKETEKELQRVEHKGVLNI